MLFYIQFTISYVTHASKSIGNKYFLSAKLDNFELSHVLAGKQIPTLLYIGNVLAMKMFLLFRRGIVLMQRQNNHVFQVKYVIEIRKIC